MHLLDILQFINICTGCTEKLNFAGKCNCVVRVWLINFTGFSLIKKIVSGWSYGQHHPLRDDFYYDAVSVMSPSSTTQSDEIVE